MIKVMMDAIFGSKNDKQLKLYRKRADRINALESEIRGLSDDEIRLRFDGIRQRVRSDIESVDDASFEFVNGLLDENLEMVFALVREASVRVLDMRHFDVQLMGAMALHDGKIAEMKTGEGKTLVATLAVVLNAIAKSVHVVTVNDYLACRDAQTMSPLYSFFGMSLGIITGGMSDDDKIGVYGNDIVYGTNNEYGFDYLRDNMRYNSSQKAQSEHFFAIIDEVDSILIDEARTPLIISGPVNKKMENYQLANSVAVQMKQDADFSIDEKNRVILITDDGIKKAESLFGIENLYAIENATLSHHLDQALKANFLFDRDKDYVIEDGEVVIVDEFTGRLSHGRRFSEGLHQALEAKEGVDIKAESQTLADITFQNYFRLYDKLSGMTGTAQTEATEFLNIYNLEVVSIPTNVPVLRKDLNDLIYKSEREKLDAVVEKVKELHNKGQPVLVGTASIEKSEALHLMLRKQRIPHTVLNAKQHAKEAEIIKNAGLKGAVTIATNMAGRGVDIKINDEVRELGGLYIIGTERHESRRIDNQLRGRSGRQGDPGVSQFYLSLEDALLRIFGSDRLKGIMGKLGMKDGESIESGMITRSVEKAQRKVEFMHFESRKHLLEYDDVINEQRKVIYRFRDDLLREDFDMQKKIDDNRDFCVDHIVSKAHVDGELDIERLASMCKEEYLIDIDNLGAGSGDIRDTLVAVIKEKYDSKFGDISREVRSEFERIIFLQVVDSLWREHLYAIDNLKIGIGLRGYNQKDPLVEYKKESYNMFLELIDNIRIQTYKALHVMQFAGTGDRELADSEKGIKGSMGLDNQNMVTNKGESAFVSSKRPNRNDPCTCGSGKKYKLCHGKSGPKRGALALTV